MKNKLLGSTGIALFVLIWFLIAKTPFLSRGVVPFPDPWDVLRKLICFLQGGSLYNYTFYDHLGSSFSHWFYGLILGVLTGLPLGILTGRSVWMQQIFLPFFSILHVIPGMAWIPVALLLFGIGARATVFMIFICALPPVVFNTQAAVRDIPSVYARASAMMELKPTALLLHVYLPAVVPGLITGVRLAFAAAWRVLISAEMILGANIGLGYSILQARWTLDFTSAFVFVLVIAGIGLIFEKGVFEPLDRKIRLRRGLPG